MADADPVAPTGDSTMSPGTALAQRRAERGLALSDVARRLKFAPRQIEALEADDYGRLPGLTFLRGMIRGYAKLLDTDAAPLIRALEARHAPAPASVEMASERIPFPDGRVRSTRIYLVLCALLVLSVGVLLYDRYFGLPEVLKSAAAPEVQAPPPASVAPAPVPPAAALTAASPASSASSEASASSSPAESQALVERDAAPQSQQAGPAAENAVPIVLEFQGESWVQVSDGVGRVLLSQLNPRGSRKTVAGEPPFALVIGNATQVRVTYKDALVDLMPYTKLDVARLTLQ